MSRRLLVLGEDRGEAEEVASAYGLAVVRRDPDLVLCHGGDGTLLRAERLLPGVPKIPARLSRLSRLCPLHELPAILGRLVEGSLPREELPLIELAVGRARFHALNDVVLRNDTPALALRFRLHHDGVPGREVTGDGLVVATPFGSTAYYHSITGGRVDEGLGVAFNNCTRPVEPLHLDGGTPLVVEVSRGPGTLVHDNDLRAIVLREGHTFAVRLAEHRRAIVLGLDALACQRCRRRDELPFNPH